MYRYLLWDVARCNGDGCARRETCMRHEQLKNMGPRTPVMSHCFVDEPGGCVTWPNYIPLDGVRPSNVANKLPP